MIPEERQRRQLEAITLDERGHEDGPRPYLDIALARVRLQVVAWLTLAGLAAAEAAVLVAGSAGVILYGVATLLLLIAGGRVTSRRLRVLLWALAVVPTSRLVAFGAPLGELRSEARLGLVGVLTLIATVIAIRATGLARDEIGLTARWRRLPLYLAMVPVGLGLGVLEAALLPSLSLADGLLPVSLAIVVAVGLVDDLFIQGLLLGAARHVVGRLALPFIALLVAVLHVGFGLWPLVVCAAVVAMVFGWMRVATGSLAGVALGHIGLNVGIFVLGPDIAPRLLPTLYQLLRSIGITSGGLLWLLVASLHCCDSRFMLIAA